MGTLHNLHEELSRQGQDSILIAGCDRAKVDDYEHVLCQRQLRVFLADLDTFIAIVVALLAVAVLHVGG